MVKVVLDTNVLVSSLLTSGPPAAIVDLIADGKICLIYNDLVLQEYWDVLSRKKFGFKYLQITRLIGDITRTGIAVDRGKPSKIAMTDEDDRIFYDLAVTSTACLITGNAKHFPSEPFIFSPAKFLELINPVAV